MGDLVRIEQGQPPWLPSPGAEVIEDLHHYDAPLEGVVRQDGIDYLFRCIAGEVEPFSLWAYAAITEPEVAAVRASDNRDTLDEVEAAIWRSERAMTVAFVTNDGIVERVDTDGPLGPDRLRVAIEHLSEAVESRLGEVRGGLERAAGMMTTLVP